MELEYTYWLARDGWYLAYLNDWPGEWTQGKTIPELEEMLSCLYELLKEDDPKDIPERKIGKLRVGIDEKRRLA